MSHQGKIGKFGKIGKIDKIGKIVKSVKIGKIAGVNVSRMSSKLLQTQPHIVENQGIAMAPLFLRLTS